MELDELKALLKDNMERVQQEKSAAQLTILLGKKTVSVASKLRRSLIIELIACCIFIIPCILVAVYGTYTSLRIYFGIFAVLCMLFIPLLISLHRKTKQLGAAALPVKSNLQTLVTILKEYVKRYFQLTMLLIPVSIILAFTLAYYDQSFQNSQFEQSFLPDFSSTAGFKIALVCIYLVVFSFGMYYFTKWYLKKLYGKYIEQLELLIAELDTH